MKVSATPYQKGRQDHDLVDQKIDKIKFEDGEVKFTLQSYEIDLSRGVVYDLHFEMGIDELTKIYEEALRSADRPKKTQL